MWGMVTPIKSSFHPKWFAMPTPKLTQLQRTGLVQSVCVKLSTGNLEGAPCGACCNPTSNNQCGDCAEGLQCVPNLRDPDDSFSIVFEPFGTCKSSSGI